MQGFFEVVDALRCYRKLCVCVCVFVCARAFVNNQSMLCFTLAGMHLHMLDKFNCMMVVGQNAEWEH